MQILALSGSLSVSGSIFLKKTKEGGFNQPLQKLDSDTDSDPDPDFRYFAAMRGKPKLRFLAVVEYSANKLDLFYNGGDLLGEA